MGHTEQLRPYQLAGAEFLASRKRAYLFDDMGLGKSAQAIRAADYILGNKVLVICPAAARVNWGREFDRFQLYPRETTIITDTKQDIPRGEGVTVINYDLVSRKRYFNQIMVQEWDVLILDEGHFLKEPESQRTKAVFGPRCDGLEGLIEKAEYAWNLSGTPVPNNPLELWPALRAMTPEAILYNDKPRSWWQFLNRYCIWAENKYRRISVKKGQNLAELRARIAPYVLRRLKKDVLTELPACQVATHYLDVNESLAQLRHMEEDPVVQEMLQTLSAGQEIDLELLAASSPHIATVRRLTGEIKARATVDMIGTEIICGLDKLVVMAWHRDAIAILYDGLTAAGIKTVRLQGGMTPKQTQAAIDDFQNDPDTKVFIGQITSAGQAITLTAASQLLFLEASWSPKVNEQARDRVYRMGQKNPVLIRFAVLPGSIDEAVTSVLQRKLTVIDELMD